MRTYLRRRTAACPTGEHIQVTDDPDDPTRQIEKTVNCTCPWLVIQETQPVPHMMVWSTPESVQRLIGEFDRGYFDLEGMPRRARSEFMSPHVSDLLDLIDAKDAVGAAMRLLATVVPDEVRWLAETSTLAIRVPFDPGHLEGKTMNTWLQLTFEPGEPIKVDRGPLPDVPDAAGKLDLSALAAIVDGEANLPPWVLWRSMLGGDLRRADMSAQAVAALTAGGLGDWEPAPAPVDGFQPLPGDDVGRQEVTPGWYEIGGTLAPATGVPDLDGVLPLREPGATLATEAEADDAEGTQDRVPGTMYGIRPHAHRTHTQADEARAMLLAAGPMGADTAEGLRRFAQENLKGHGAAGVHNPLIEGPCVQIPCPPFSPDSPGHLDG